MAESKDQQVRHVVEGLALGVLAAGIRSVPNSKIAVEFALSFAWSSWSQSTAFPSIGRVPKPDNLLWGGILRSDRSHAFWGAWEVSDRLRPYLRQGHWAPEDGLELLADD